MTTDPPIPILHGRGTPRSAGGLRQKRSHHVSFEPSIDSDDDSPPSKRPALRNDDDEDDEGDEQIMIAVVAVAVHSPLATELRLRSTRAIRAASLIFCIIIQILKQCTCLSIATMPPCTCNNAVIEEATSTDASDEGNYDNNMQSSDGEGGP